MLIPDVAGDVPAEGRIVVTPTQTCRSVVWGAQSKNYSAATTAAVFWEAEALTPMGGAATAVGATGASGTGSNVVRQTNLAPAGQAILSTNRVSDGAHLTHKGVYRVFVRTYRPTSNGGQVSLALEWAESDLSSWSRNGEQVWSVDQYEGAFVTTDLGIVVLSPVLQGAQRWEGRLVASSTVAGDEIDVDWLVLIPVDDGYGEVSAPPRFDTPTSFSARDEFDQAAGVLAGKTLPVGGTWSGAGDTDDFSVETTGKTAQRATVSDGFGSGVVLGRRALAGTGTLAATGVQVDFKRSADTGAIFQGAFARYVDESNLLMAYIHASAGAASPGLVVVNKIVGGAITGAWGADYGMPTVDAWHTLRLAVYADGTFHVWVLPRDGHPGDPIVSGYDPDLATGGTLASGRFGMYDGNATAGANTRSYDNFFVFAATEDAVAFAGQSLELRHDGVIREDASGAVWGRPRVYRGSPVFFRPSGDGGYTTQLVVMPFKNDYHLMPDGGQPGTTTVQTYYTPARILVPR